jgi:prepilin-type N-terminal cleavage/methylation domain-containing protein
MKRQSGFTLVETVVALALTLIVMAAVYGLLSRGQETFRREPEVTAVLQNARNGLERISGDLALAGYKTPGASAIIWSDGGGINPDQITIIYADPDVPTTEPVKCGGAGVGGGGGPCGTISQSSTLLLDPRTMDPLLDDPAQAYSQGMILFAIETADCNGDGQVGIYPFEVTQPPVVSSAGGATTLNLNHNPGNTMSELNPPGGFNGQVHPDCALVGRYRVIQYRVSPSPATPNPNLERRDLAINEPWIPLSANVENLQFQYASENNPTPADIPAPPNGNDPLSWITRVSVTVGARSESRNLQGGSAGVFSPDHSHLRKTFGTSVNLRNVSFEISNSRRPPT